MPEVPIFDLATLVHRAAIVMPGKALVTKPADGSGDLDFSRAGTAVRIDSEGNEETMPANVCRVDYRFTFDGNNTCPVELVTAEDSEALSLSNLVANGFTFDNCALWYTDNFQRIVKVFSSGTVTTYIDGQEVSSGAGATPTSVSFPEGDYSTLQDLVIIKGVVDSSTAISLSTNPLLSTYTPLMIASYVNLLVKGYTVPSAAAYLSSCNEVSRLFDLGFRSFLMPGFLKAGSIPFQKFSESGGNPVYPPELIEAAFIRANTPEDSGESGAVYIDRLGDFKTLGLNLPRLTYKAGGRETEYDTPYLSFLPSAKNIIDYNSDLSAVGWTRRGVISVTPSAKTYKNINLSLLENLGSAGVDDIFATVSGLVASDRYEIGFFIDKNGNNNKLNIHNPFGSPDGRWLVDLSLVEDGVQWINRNHESVTILNEFEAGATGVSGVQFISSAASIDIFLGGITQVQKTSAVEEFELIPTSGTGLTRQRDVLPNLNLITSGLLPSSTDFSIIIQTALTKSSSAAFAKFRLGSLSDSLKLSIAFTPVETYFNDHEGGGAMSPRINAPDEFNKYVITVENGSTIKLWYNGINTFERTEANAYIIEQLTDTGLLEGKADFKAYHFGNLMTAEEAIAASAWATLPEMYSDLNYDNQ